MKRIFTIWILIILPCLICNAQKLIVKSFSMATNDLTASTQRRNDANGKACALIKLQLANSDALFEGDIVGTVDYSQSEYKIYMSSGSLELKVMIDGYSPFAIAFADYGIPSLESLSTYRLVMMLPKHEGPDAQVGQLDVNYEPHGAEVWIDGEMKGTTPSLVERLSPGYHSVEIRKDGYLSEEESVVIVSGMITSLNGSLIKSDEASGSNNADDTSTSNLVFTVNGISFKMIYVEGGIFTMGATPEQGSDAYDTERPTHSVTLSSYYIAETEVTQELWEAVMGNNPSYFKEPNHPVEMVSWNDSQEFIRRLNQLTGRNFRLPTESEWEFAARGGTKSKGYIYSGSNDINSVAWNKDNLEDKKSSKYYNGTGCVKNKKANELMLYDMSGNVYEWCQDWSGYYISSSQTNPSGPTHGQYRVLRGGCYSVEDMKCRVSSRFNAPPHIVAANIGLRLVL